MHLLHSFSKQLLVASKQQNLEIVIHTIIPSITLVTIV